MVTTFRPSHALDLVQSNLGLLGDLPGTFIGTGFNLIARPDKQNNKPFVLEVNATQEILEFTNIGGDIPNRGSVQDDVTLHGVHYLQRVADCELHSAIHLEPGLWVRVDPTAAPNPVTPESYVRLATIPHGDSLLALSTFAARLNTGPTINPVDTTPFTGDIPDLNSSPASPVTSSDYLSPYRETPLPTECLPAGLDAVQTIRKSRACLAGSHRKSNHYRNGSHSDFHCAGEKRRYCQYSLRGSERQRCPTRRHLLDREGCRSIRRTDTLHPVAICATGDSGLRQHSLAAYVYSNTGEDAVKISA